jgi:hypothetical protein
MSERFWRFVIEESRVFCHAFKVYAGEEYAVPSGTVWYVRDITLEGDIYIDGELKVIG